MKKNYLKNIKYTALLLIIAVGIGSCKKTLDSKLDVIPQDQISDPAVWSNESAADLFLNDIYGRLFDGNNTWDPFDNFSDNSMCGLFWPSSKSSVVKLRQYNPINGIEFRVGYTDATNLPFEWTHQYSFIRKCNVFIQKVNENSSNFSEAWRKKRLAEARFFRAFFYQNLWLAYGELPIITEPLNLSIQGDSIYTPRSAQGLTYKFITDELTAIAEDLPSTATGNDYGRITKGAALTLKGWVELFNGNFSESAATNKEIIDMGIYTLYPDYAALFLPAGNINNEGILFRQYISGALGGRQLRGPTFDKNGIEVCWGGVNPSQQLVDDYSMSNGKSISTPNSGYDAQNPYVNREPRFYNSVVYDGSDFNGAIYYSRIGIGSPNEIDVNERNDGGNTGYGLRKGVDTSNLGSPNWGGATSTENYYFFRYADVLLNYAEAKIEVGQLDQSVYDAINQIRSRSRIPSIEVAYGGGLSQSQLRDIVRRERRVELAFENKRYWDLIRWKTAEIELNTPIKAMKITIGADSVLNYGQVPAFNGDRKFNAPTNYKFPIWQNIIDQNKNITQNPGY